MDVKLGQKPEPPKPPLSPEETARQWRLYRIYCAIIIIAAAWLFVALPLVLFLAPDAKSLHGKVGGGGILFCLPALCALFAMQKLRIMHEIEETPRVRQIKAGVCDLPYRLRRNYAPLIVFILLITLLSLMMLPRVLTGEAWGVASGAYGSRDLLFELPAWTILPLILWLPLGVLVGLAYWQSLTLYEEHLSYILTGRRYNVRYYDISGVTVLAEKHKGANIYFLLIHHYGSSQSPLKVGLTGFQEEDYVLLLNVIIQRKPSVRLYGLAHDMKECLFPVA